MKEPRMTSPPHWAGTLVNRDGRMLKVWFQDVEINVSRDYEHTSVQVSEEQDGFFEVLATTSLEPEQTAQWRTESGEIKREGRQALADEVVDLLMKNGQIK